MDAIDNACNFAAIVDALAKDAANTGIPSVLLSRGGFALADTDQGAEKAFFGHIDETDLDPAFDTGSDCSADYCDETGTMARLLISRS